MTDLMPCPFCGATDTSVHRLKNRHEVMCDACDSAGPLMATGSEAVWAWNLRAAPASPESFGVSQDESHHPLGIHKRKE